MVRFTLRQTTSLVEQVNAAPLYRVVNHVTAADEASPAAFVFRTDTRRFEYYATAADLTRWPDSYEEAQIRGLAYYRAAMVTRDWATLEEMYKDVDSTKRRLNVLARDVSQQRGAITTDVTTVIEAG